MPKGRNANVGTLYAIPDPGYGWYFACWAAGGDMMFADHVTQSSVPAPEIDRFFLRLWVSYPSMKRAGWVKLGKITPNAEMLAYGKYRRKSFDDQFPYIRDMYDGRETIALNGETDHLEISAVWDAQEHMIPLLRYHFFREEMAFTKQLLQKITAKI